MARARKRRGLSMTPLVDIIFLLLLFFMLTSTFTRFAEVELTSAMAGDGPSDSRPMFLQLGPEAVTLNGREIPLDALAGALAQQKEETAVLVSIKPEVTAQRLTDLLVVLRALPALHVTVLGS